MMMKKFFTILLLAASVAAFAAPAPFELPGELVLKAPAQLRNELKKHKVNTAAYTGIAMKILEDRIQKRMKLMEFELDQTAAAAGMASADSYRPSDVMIQLTPAEKRKLFAVGGEKNTKLMLRYIKSFKLRQETVRLFRTCRPAMPNNRFHSALFSLLEFQHIYLEQELNKFRKSVR